MAAIFVLLGAIYETPNTCASLPLDFYIHRGASLAGGHSSFPLIKSYHQGSFSQLAPLPTYIYAYFTVVGRTHLDQTDTFRASATKNLTKLGNTGTDALSNGGN